MAIITTWSLQSPNAQAWQPSIDPYGTVTFAPVGAVITVTPPVYADELSASVVYTPTISNTGILTLTSGADTGQLRAALVDVNGAQYLACVSRGIAFYRAPQVNAGDLFTFGLYTMESVPVLVKSIQPGADLTAMVSFVDAAPGVHQAATGIIPPFNSHITLPRTGIDPVPQPKIDRMASDETVMIRSTDGSLTPRIVISLHLPSGSAAPAEHLEEQHRLAGSSSSWERQLFSASSIAEISIYNVREGLNYDIRLRTIGSAGQTSPWTTVLTYAVVGKTSPPPDVTGLSINGQQLVWLYPDPPLDLAGFRVRVHVGQRISWGDALPLHDALVSQSTFTLFRDTGQRTYLVKAVDTSGNESLNPATFFADYGALQFQNVAELVDFKTSGFPGTITNGTVIGGSLVANSDTLFWKSDGLPFWTFDDAIMWPGTYVEMSYTALITPPYQWLGGVLYLALDITANGYRVDYAQDSGAPFWGDAAALLWEDDNSLFWSGLPSVFATWPGKLSGYTRQAYQFRITTYGGNIQGTIAQFQAIFDMVDIEERLLNVRIADDGSTRLPVTKPFAAILIVSPTLVEDGGSAVRIRTLDKEVRGPLVVAVDSNGGLVTGHADFIVKGY